MLPNPGTHSSVCKISDDNKQENRQSIIEERIQTKQQYLFLEVYFYNNDLELKHILDIVCSYFYLFRCERL